MPALAPRAENPLIAVIRRYANDPVLFVREMLGGDPDEKQRELLNAIARGERKIAVKSGHGVGKTTSLAWAIIWHITTRFPQKTICTAPTSDQLFGALAAEVKAWLTKLTPQMQELFEVQAESIFLRAAPEESFVAFRTSRPEKPEALAGFHSANMLIIGDEASGIPDPVYESAAGSMSGENAITLLAGNPIRSTGLFYDAFHKPGLGWKTISISCVGHPRVTQKFVEDMKLRYGEYSNAFRTRVLGEFPLADDDTVIPRELMASALFRDVKAQMVVPIWGLDCARFGSDASALARRRGNALMRPIEVKRGLDTMQLAGWVKATWDQTLPSERPSEILVDSIGLGAGVLDRLVELKLPARGINVSESPTIFDEQYLNQRAELWFKGLNWLRSRDSSLAGDTELGEELVIPKYFYSSSGKLQVESKQDMKKRGKDSPNRADAFLLTLASDAVTAIHGSAGRSASWSKAISRRIKGIN